MYSAEFKIGDLTERPIFENWEYTQDIGGGNIKNLNNSFYQWAYTEQMGGRPMNINAEKSWEYDLKVVVRSNDNIVSSTTMVYDNARYVINSIIDDGRFMELKCSFVEGELVTGGIITPFGPAYVYNYEAIGTEDSFQANELINKTLIGAFKDGIAFKIIFTGSPNVKEVLYEAATGTLTFNPEFYPGETAIIQYI
jgi:head-tail adaptor